MTHIDIPKGEKESPPMILAHHDIATIFSDSHDIGTEITILGSHDGVKYGPILVGGNSTSFFINKEYTVHVFNPDDFTGIAYIKFSRDNVSNNDLRFWIHLRAY